jgi:hypothetical protein
LLRPIEQVREIPEGADVLRTLVEQDLEFRACAVHVTESLLENCDATQAERRKIVEPARFALEPVRAIGQVLHELDISASRRESSLLGELSVCVARVDLEDTLPSAPRRIHVGAPLVKSSEALESRQAFFSVATQGNPLEPLHASDLIADLF